MNLAMQCMNCGQALPRGDARFCSNCGTPLSPPLADPQATPAPEHPAPLRAEASSPARSEKKKTVLREQIAQQPTSFVSTTPAPPLTSTHEFPVEVQDQQATPIPAAPEEDSSQPVEPAEKASVGEGDSASPSPMSTGEDNAIADQPTRSMESLFAPLSALPPAQRQASLIVVGVLVFVLLLGGLGTWIVTYQPFSASPVTRPWQSFKDAGLGLSLLYPTGWTWKVDRKSSMVMFTDSTRTAQVTAAVAPANSAVESRYMQQQAKQLGMAAVKPAGTLSFAGSSWQQIQGTVQVNGASYSVSILATVRNNRLYTIVQKAPTASYNDEESVIFAPMRVSWRFLA